MKFPVASLSLITSVSLLAAIAPAQTAKRRANKNAPGKARSATVKICQGVPIPAGYVVTAYMTTAACPHGAYVIKKQDTYSDSSVVANKEDDAESESSVPANKQRNNESPGQVAANARVRQPAGTSGLASRPRRVGAVESDPDLPSLSDAETAPNRTRPTLKGVTSGGTSVDEPTDLAPPPGPEEVGEGDVVRVETELVTVPVSVVDRQGRFVSNLRQEDFSIFENGVEQKIAYFEPAEKPFTVALLLDTSPSTHFHMWEIKEAAIGFARQLRPQDRVLVVSFNDQVLLLTEATNDLNIVSSVIQQNANLGRATRVYDAIDLVVKERLEKIKGRKAIVLFTDGVDTASYLATYDSTLHKVEEVDALIYPIQYDTSDYLRAMQGSGSVTITSSSSNSNWPFSSSSSSQTVYSGPSTADPGGTPIPGTTQAEYDRANKYLHELANKSGGRLYRANDRVQLAQAFTRIAEELRRQYSLGYYPQTSGVNGGERRQIRVRVHQPNLAVSARDGYLRPSTSPPPR